MTVTAPHHEKEKYIIRTEALGREFNGDIAVEDVTMAIPRGTIFGFIGPSGSGKTTTIRMLTGVYAPTGGEVQVMGEAPFHFSTAARERIGYMPQFFVLYPNLTVWENLNFAASLYGMSLFRRNKRLHELLDFVELTEHRGKLARNISGGMQRRLSLASTLLHDPELIFLDEPTAGIDPVLRRKFWDHFRELKAAGRTLFITTQYVSEAAYCDLVGVLSNSRLLILDTPEGLRDHAYGGDIIDLRTAEPLNYETRRALGQLPFVHRPVQLISDLEARLIVDDASTDIQGLLAWFDERGLAVESIEEYQPPFEDVFVELVEGDSSGH